MLELSEELKKLRIEKGFSQEELSEKSGLSLRTIQRIENSESRPREDTLNLLTKALDLPTDYFISKNLNQVKIKDSKFPWFIIGSVIIGASIGIVLSVIIIISKPKGLNDFVSSILVIASALLFSGIGVVIGNILEKKYN